MTRINSGPVVTSLQAAYDRSVAILTDANGPVDISRALADSDAALSLSMGASTLGAALEISNLGSGPDLQWGASNIKGGSIFLEEKAAPLASVSGLGQIFVQNDSPNTLWFINDVGTPIQLGAASLAGLGVPTYTTAQDARDTTGSTGVISGGEIADDGDGTITVAAGTGLIRGVNSPLEVIYNFDWASEAGTNVDLVDASMNYVYAEYNAGTPQVVATTVKSADKQTRVLLAAIYRIGTTLHISGANHRHINDHVCLMVDRLTQTEPFERGTGGIISETGTRNYAITAGLWWHGLDSFSTAAFDSSGADVFEAHYQDGVGGWTTVAAQSQIDNLQYDDGTGVLATLANNQYGVHWAYLGQDDDQSIVYGRGSYTLLEAIDAQPPSDLPPWFDENHKRIVGKIIIAKSAAAFTSIESPFTTQFQGAAPTDHGSLIGLGDDDHVQYLLIDGSRAMTGSLSAATGISSDPGYGFSAFAGTGHYASAAGLLFVVGGAGAMNVTTSNLQLQGAGTESVPAILRISDSDTGPYWPAANTWGVSTGGIEAVRWDASQIQTNAGVIYAVAGLASAPGISRAADPNTGLFFSATDAVSLASGGQERVRVNNFQLSLAYTSSAIAPGLTPRTDSDTGLFWINPDIFAVSTGGTEATRWNASQQTLVPNGTALLPTFSFVTDPSAGLGFSTGRPGISVGGAVKAEFSGSQIINNNSGSEALPALVLSRGDTNTGFWGPAGDITALSTGGIEAARWDASQNQINAGDIILGIGQSLVFDNDLDTYLESPSDDTLNVRVGGTLTAQFKSTTIFHTYIRPNANLGQNVGHTNTRWLNLYARNTDLRYDAVGEALTAGVSVANETAAVTGTGDGNNQQYSPAVILEGQAFKSDATAASKFVRFAQQIETREGAASVFGSLVFSASVEDVASDAYQSVLSLDVRQNVATAGISVALDYATSQIYMGDNGSRVQVATDTFSFYGGTSEMMRVDDDATAGNTRFMIYDVDNATLERVSVGAADSGGAGFKLLRVPN